MRYIIIQDMPADKANHVGQHIINAIRIGRNCDEELVDYFRKERPELMAPNGAKEWDESPLKYIKGYTKWLMNPTAPYTPFIKPL